MPPLRTTSSTVGRSVPSGVPRELAPSVFWISGCLQVKHGARPLHVSHSVYLVVGNHCSALVDGGHPQDAAVNMRQILGLLRDAPELRYVFVTHTETPHTGLLSMLLDRYPLVSICGDVSDLHLVFPDKEMRFCRLSPGDELDLGGTRIVAVNAVIRDQRPTLWAFATRQRVLFTSDGFAYSHHHEAGHCALVAEEVSELDIPDMAALFAELALYWTRFVDLGPYIARLEQLVLTELEVAVIAPSHGLPSIAPQVSIPRIRAGLVRASGDSR
jgi:flavorubredoxin